MSILAISAIILASVAFLVIGFAAFFVARVLRRSPLNTGNVSENLYTIRTGSVNFFIYKDAGDAVAFDAGFNVRKGEFDKVEIDPTSISHVFLTHTDMDHTGGLKLMTNARIYIGKNEEQMLNLTRKRMFGLAYNRLQSKAYTLIEDGEEITVGKIKIKAVATPGHTPGSTTYLVTGRILIVGDAFKLINGDVGQGPFHRIFTMDQIEWEKSIRKLARLKGIDILCTAHSGCTREFERATTKWRD